MITEQELIAKYPGIFRNLSHGDFECRSGWNEIIDRLCQSICDAGLGGKVIAGQVKEKFGGLRFYYEGSSMLTEGEFKSLWSMLESAERESLVTCEGCGSRESVHANYIGYMRTLCPECRAAWKEKAGRFRDMKSEAGVAGGHITIGKWRKNEQK